MIWNEDDVPMLKLDTKNISPEDRPIVELHLYTVGKLDESNYITGGQIDDFEWDKDTIKINSHSGLLLLRLLLLLLLV